MLNNIYMTVVEYIKKNLPIPMSKEAIETLFDMHYETEKQYKEFPQWKEKWMRDNKDLYFSPEMYSLGKRPFKIIERP
jgi:hypothetical protein